MMFSRVTIDVSDKNAFIVKRNGNVDFSFI